MLVHKEQIKGRVKQAKGKIKQVAGHPLNDGKIETKSKIEKNPGKVQVSIYDSSMM